MVLIYWSAWLASVI